MKISKKGWGYYILFIVTILLWYQLFYLIAFPQSIDNILKIDNFMPIVSFISLFLLIILLVTKNKIIKKYNDFFSYIYWLIFAVLLLVVYSILKYPEQSIFTTFKIGISFLVIIFSVPVLLMLEKSKYTVLVWKIINLVAFLWYMVIIIQTIYYSKYGLFLFDFWTYFQRYFNQGQYGLRISLHAFGNIMVLYNLVNLYYKRGLIKFWHMMNFIVGISALIFIQQTRALYVYLAICIMCIILKNKNKKLISKITIMFFIIYVLIFTDFIPSFISSFSIYGDNSISTEARIYSIQYYFMCFLRNPIFGNGLADGYEESVYAFIEHGPLGIAYYSDIGFIGLLANTGIFSLVILVWPIARLIKQYKITKEYMADNQRDFMFISIIYLIITSFTYLITESKNAILFPILIGYFEYYTLKVRLENGEIKL